MTPSSRRLVWQCPRHHRLRLTRRAVNNLTPRVVCERRTVLQKNDPFVDKGHPSVYKRVVLETVCPGRSYNG